MPGCAIALCPSYSRVTKGTGVIYHRFPKNPKLRSVWIAKCKRKDKINVKDATICSRHFTKEDYIRDLKAELLGLPPRRSLKLDSIPSQNLPYQKTVDTNMNSTTCPAFPGSDSHQESRNTDENVDDSSGALSRDDRYQAREVRKRALETLRNLPPIQKHFEEATQTEEVVVLSAKEVTHKDTQVRMLTSQLERLRNEVVTLQTRKRFLTEQLRMAKNALQLAQQNVNQKVEKRVAEVLCKQFTKKQIHCLLKNKKSTTWSEEDITQALKLRAISRKCYSYLRHSLAIPLPAPTTLRRWAKNPSRCEHEEIAAAIVEPLADSLQCNGVPVPEVVNLPFFAL